jgi:hypothetical protein
VHLRACRAKAGDLDGRRPSNRRTLVVPARVGKLAFPLGWIALREIRSTLREVARVRCECEDSAMTDAPV